MFEASGAAFFCPGLDLWRRLGSCIDLTESMALGAVIPLGAEEAFLAINTFPRVHADEVHEPVFEGPGSRTATG